MTDPAIELARQRAKERKKQPAPSTEPSPVPPADNGFQVSEMLSNVAPSARDYFGSAANAVMHPVRTAKVMGSAGMGAGQYLGDFLDAALSKVPSVISEPAKATAGAMVPVVGAATIAGDATSTDYRPYAKAVADFYVERYGSVDKALQTLESDPVGSLADASTVLGMAGAPSISAATNPVNIVKNILKVGAKAVIPKGMPERMYASAAKFSTTIPTAERAAMVRTALQNRLNLSPKGVDRLEGMISNYNDDISNLIQTAEKSGKTIPKTKLYQYVAELKARRGGVKFNAGADLKSIDDMIAAFDDHLSAIGKTDLSPSEVQGLKVDLYNLVNWDAKNQTLTPVKEDVYKTVARAAKDELENVSPEIGLTNDQLAPLYDLQPNLARSSARIDNRNIIGLQAPVEIGVGSAAGGSIAGPPGAAVGGGIGATAALLGMPKVKGATAIKIQQLLDDGYIQTIMRNNPGISSAELAAILAERITSSGEKDKRQQ